LNKSEPMNGNIMKKHESIKVLVGLANGEIRVRNNSVSSKKIIRAMSICEQLIIELFEQVYVSKIKLSDDNKRARNILKGLPRDTGVRWSPEAKEKLLELYESGEDVEKMAKFFNRTPKGIEYQLENF